MDDEHVLALIEAVNGTDFDAVHELAFDAFVLDDIGHLGGFLWVFMRDVTETRETVN
jgi:hypothetical protein